MKHFRFFRVLAAAVILALLMLAIPITPALAASISLSVSSAPPDTVITVYGSGYTDEDTGYVWFDINGDDTWNTGEPRALVTIPATGSIPAGTILAVPTVSRGTYEVEAAIGSDTVATPFVITPKVVLDDDEGYVGDTVSVDGSGFLGNATITIYYDGSNVGTKATNGYGTFDNFTFTLPASTEGIHYIDARDTTGYILEEVPYDVSPKITIIPPSGAVGDTVTVSGAGFDDSSTVTITFDAVTMTTAATNLSGTLAATTFTVPAASRGSHIVMARDTGGNYATATFPVGQKITIDPTSGPSGTTVTVTGSGFAASSTITITYDGDTVTTDPTPLTTNSAGNFSAEFDVPVGDAGTYVVSVSDASANTATANFVSTTNATISQTTTTTAPGNVGMELIITGVGFTPNHEITITYTSDPVVFTTTSLADGSFSYTFTIPPSLGGAHTITVSDGTITKTFTFVMESNPPPIPAILLPVVGEKAKSETVFDWDPVDDVAPASDPVTYDLQVATSEDFSLESILIDVTGLTESTYTLLEEEKLESTGEDAPYYWQVRAVDAASNASDWNNTGSFYVGFSFEFTGWVVWVTMVVIALLFFFLGLWLGRRGGGGEYW